MWLKPKIRAKNKLHVKKPQIFNMMNRLCLGVYQRLLKKFYLISDLGIQLFNVMEICVARLLQPGLLVVVRPCLNLQLKEMWSLCCGGRAAPVGNSDHQRLSVELWMTLSSNYLVCIEQQARDLICLLKSWANLWRGQKVRVMTAQILIEYLVFSLGAISAASLSDYLTGWGQKT